MFNRITKTNTRKKTIHRDEEYLEVVHQQTEKAIVQPRIDDGAGTPAQVMPIGRAQMQVARNQGVPDQFRTLDRRPAQMARGETPEHPA